MRVCLAHANQFERFADDCDVSSAVGAPVKIDDKVVGVVTKAWIEDGSLYADLEVRGDIEQLIAGELK